MRPSIIVATHNDGDLLGKTLASCIEAGLGPDSEIIVADDASTDNSVKALSQQFPGVRLCSHDRRQGASPTKALGAHNAKGDVLVFLDGHCKPEAGSIERLLQDVERLDGKAVITPAIPALDVDSWTNDLAQVGNGYWVDLLTLECGWSNLEAMRAWSSGTNEFYESPSAIGCALAVSRDLYRKLKGFDANMRYWGVEDLDFGLKCWLMGHQILHDPNAVIGHRFQSTFRNYSVPMEHLLVNQLRMAYKNFTVDVWKEWLERCQLRHLGAVADHPEGLWAQAWSLFNKERHDVENERSYLLSNRAHGEFWYAQKFGLAWPVMAAGSHSAPLHLPRGLTMSPHPSGHPSPHPSAKPSPSPKPSAGPSPHPSVGPSPHPSAHPSPIPSAGPKPCPSPSPIHMPMLPHSDCGCSCCTAILAMVSMVSMTAMTSMTSITSMSQKRGE